MRIGVAGTVLIIANSLLPQSLGAMVRDTGFSTFGAACSAAVSSPGSGTGVLVTRVWTGLKSQSCAAHLVFEPGGMLQPEAGQTVLLSGSITSAPLTIFDTSRSGIVSFGMSGATSSVYPEWWGAAGDGVHDDAQAIQQAINATSTASFGNSAPSSTAAILLGQKSYRIASGLVEKGWNFKLSGVGKYGSALSYAGPPGGVALSIRGFHASISDVLVASVTAGGWQSGINYEGSQGEFTRVFVDCNGHPGDAITAGREGAGQSDQLTLDKATLASCTYGNGFRSFHGNALSIVLQNPSVYGNFSGVSSSTSTNVSVFGGEFDYNIVNFLPGAGSTFLVLGVRSEGSSRTAFSATGAYPQPFTLKSYDLASINRVRPRITAKVSAGSNRVLFSSPGLAPGDFVTITGAGPAGGVLVTRLSNYVDSVNMLMDNPASTATDAGLVILTKNAPENTIELRGAGPYEVSQSEFNGDAGFTFGFTNGLFSVIGNSWSGNVESPFPMSEAKAVSGALVLQNNRDCATACRPMANIYPRNQAR